MTSPPHSPLPNTLPMATHEQPPLLPPPASSTSEEPPPYSLIAMQTQDPRSSSTQSLVPDPAVQESERRRLLLVYIHGFMGDETSFRSFPAHVHNLVTLTLADSHVVHTKLYPRYQSKNALEVARDHFSSWLAPHEDDWTDIILLGHSMGGLLAADVALILRHRIIGIINFDVPFMGIHPGIVKAGLESIFNPSPAPTDVTVQEQGFGKKPSRVATLFNPKPSDPNYNPSYENDVHLPVRKGWNNTLHWVGKHYKDGLRQATKGLVKSHLEFGSAMADYGELKDRYARVRLLEEDDESKRKLNYPQARFVPRIRFVNYYTASTGRPKKPKSPKSTSPSRPPSRQSQHQEIETNDFAATSPSATEESTNTLSHTEPAENAPRVSIEVQEYCGDDIVPISHREPPSATSKKDVSPPQTATHESETPPDMPEIPPIPQEPPFVDLMQFSDKAERKAAEKKHEQALKEYQKAVKARNKIINRREKCEEKWTKQQQKRAESKQKQETSIHSQSELDRLQAESERMEAESERMRGGAEKRQTDSQTHHQDIESTSTPVGLETNVENLHLENTSDHTQTFQTPYTNYHFSRSMIMNQSSPDDQSSLAESSLTLHTDESHITHPTPSSETDLPAKKKKLKKFCLLPPKDADGNKDSTWIRVFMDGMDEVTAHTSLFFLNDTYEKLVGDVGARIEEWTREADSVRLVRELQGLS